MTGFLVRMRRRGKTYGWIAKALGVSRAVCVGRAVKMGLLLRPVVRNRIAAAPRRDEPRAIGAPREVLGEGACHWVAGDLDDPDWRMCGHPTVHRTMWCAHHLARVLVLASERDGDADGPAPRRVP